MGETKKVSSTGRFGARYGVTIKKRVLKIEQKQKQKHVCPSCGFAKVKRKSRGIFECRKCSHVFAGGAFLPQTLSGGIIKKMVSQKSFLPLVQELTEAQAEKETLETAETEENGTVEKPGKKTGEKNV